MATDRPFEPAGDEAARLMDLTGTDPRFRNRCRVQEGLHGYEAACEPFATCRYLETLGGGGVAASFEPLLDVHDTTSRALEELPLA